MIQRGVIIALAVLATASADASAAVRPVRYVLRDRYTPPEAALNDDFALSMAVDGDTVMVGAPSAYHGIADAHGAVYVLSLKEGVFQLVQKLGPPDSADRDEYFGANLALEGEVAAVSSSPRDATNLSIRGWARTFSGGTAGWQLARTLPASTNEFYGGFGGALAVSADTVAVSAPSANVGEHLNQGCITVFDHAVSWSEGALVTRADGNAGDYFGSSISLEGDRLLVGVPGANVEGVDHAGAVEIYQRSAAGWTRTATLISRQPVASDYFGFELTHRGGVLLVKSGLVASPPGVNVYLQTGGIWTWSGRLPIPPSSTPVGGMSVGRDRVALGVVTRDDEGANSRWEVLVFRRGADGWELAGSVQTAQSATYGWATPALLDDGSLVVAFYATSGPGAVYLFRDMSESEIPQLSVAGTVMLVLMLAGIGNLILRRGSRGWSLPMQ